MYVSNHQIAGINFRIQTEIRIPWLDNSYFRSFVKNGVEQDVFFQLACIYPDALIQPPFNFQTNKFLSHSFSFNHKNIECPLLRSGIIHSRLRMVINHPENVVLDIEPSSVVIFDFKQFELNIFLACDSNNDYSNSRLGPALFAPFLVAFNAAMIHSSGMICGDRAAVFMAPDEGGKTTVVKLAGAQAYDILSDDQVIIRQKDGMLMAHGTPWSRYTDGPISARLGGLFLLEQADIFELTPLKTVDAIDYLWNEHQGHWAFLPQSLRLQAFDFLLSICHQVPTYRMRFPKDHVDWDAIIALMVK